MKPATQCQRIITSPGHSIANTFGLRSHAAKAVISTVFTLFAKIRRCRFPYATRILDTSNLRDQYKKSVLHTSKRLFFGPFGTYRQCFAQSASALFLLSAITLAQDSLAQSATLCTDNDFSMEFGEDWQRVEVNQAGLLCAYKIGTGFPTFNVIRVPGPYPEAGLPLETQGARFVESYRSAGISDAKLTCIEKQTIGQIPTLIASFSYTNQGSAMESRLAMISTSEWYYLATEVRKAGQSPMPCTAAGSVLASIRVKNKPTELPGSSWISLPKIGLALGLIVLVFGTLHYRKRFSGS